MIVSLQKIWTKPFDSYRLVLRSQCEPLKHQVGSCIDFNGGTEIPQISFFICVSKMNK